MRAKLANMTSKAATISATSVLEPRSATAALITNNSVWTVWQTSPGTVGGLAEAEGSSETDGSSGEGEADGSSDAEGAGEGEADG
jgi:hypothetical protein